MAGYSGITVGKVDERYVMIPIHGIARKSRKISLASRHFERLMTTTGQKDLKSGPGDEWKLMPPYPSVQGATLDDWEAYPDPGPIWWSGVAKPEEVGKPSEIATPRIADVQLQIQSGTGEILEERELNPTDILGSGKVPFRRLELMKLSDKFGAKNVPSPLRGRIAHFLDGESWATEAVCTDGPEYGDTYFQTVRAGPREFLQFTTKDSMVAIVTCGSLCPGENVVVRELVMTFLREYGITKIFGIHGGLKGIVDRSSWKPLDEEIVQDIHNVGGTILQAEGGHPSPKEAAEALMKQVYASFLP
jgi:hypothetical protein